jgi:hypothetical protein
MTYEYDFPSWRYKKESFVFNGLALEIILFCKPSLKARLDYINWSKQQ